MASRSAESGTSSVDLTCADLAIPVFSQLYLSPNVTSLFPKAEVFSPYSTTHGQRYLSGFTKFPRVRSLSLFLIVIKILGKTSDWLQ